MQRNSIKFILLLSGASILFIISCSVGAVAYYFGTRKKLRSLYWTNARNCRSSWTRDR